MEELLRLTGTAERQIILVGVGMARLTPIFMIVPFLGKANLGTLARGSMVFAFAIYLRPWLESVQPAGDFGAAEVLPLIAKETLLGTLIGVVSGFAFEAASGVGIIIDNQRGLSMAQTTDPLTGEQTSPLGSMMLQTLVLVFMAAGGYQLFFYSVITTYAFWSPFAYWPDWSAGAVKALLLGQFGWYMLTMVTLAAPVLLVIFLVDLGMGLMNRFAPQLNVFFLSMPVKSAFALAVLIVYWGGMFELLRRDALRLPTLWDAFMKATET